MKRFYASIPGQAKMSRNRFQIILKCLHFSNNEDNEGNEDRICKIRPLLDVFLKKYQDVFSPRESTVRRNASSLAWSLNV